jgi:hypothetical protein
MPVVRTELILSLGPEERKDFLNFLVYIVRSLPIYLRILVTSRPE